MTSISESKEKPTVQTSPVQQKLNRTNGKLYYYNGSYQMVFEDAGRGNREYIVDKKGNKLYLDELAIFSFQNDKKAQQEKLLSGFDEQEKNYEKQKDAWYKKFVAENKKYDVFSAAKEVAQKGYQKVLSLTGCSDLSDLKSFDKLNGSNYLKQAETFLADKHTARAGQISAESMSAFYGRMYVDENKNVADMQCMKIMAQSIFSS